MFKLQSLLLPIPDTNTPWLIQTIQRLSTHQTTRTECHDIEILTNNISSRLDRQNLLLTMNIY